jgi:hypothetical protein
MRSILKNSSLLFLQAEDVACIIWLSTEFEQQKSVGMSEASATKDQRNVRSPLRRRRRRQQQQQYALLPRNALRCRCGAQMQWRLQQKAAQRGPFGPSSRHKLKTETQFKM